MATRLDGIQNYLQNIRPQTSPLDSMMLQRSLNTSPPILKSGTTFPNAGLFGGPATLPSGAGPVDPPILTGGGYNNVPTTPSYSLGPLWSGPASQSNNQFRMPPGIGTIPNFDPNNPTQYGSIGSIPNYHPNNPTEYGSISPVGSGGGGGDINTSYQSPTQIRPGGIVGTNGPQGTPYATDPNTGQPIFNVTGSPRPGFFDSKTGKFVEFVGSAGLNALAPGLGFGVRTIFDAVRRSQARHNTGTDLSGNPVPGGGTAGGAGGQQSSSEGPPGYGTSWGGGLYTTPMDATTKGFLLSGGYGGAPNSMRGTPEEGRNRFDPSSGFTGQLDPETGIINRRNTPYNASLAFRFANNPSGAPYGIQNTDALNAWTMARPEYAQWLAKQSVRQPALPIVPPLQIQPPRGG